MRLHRLRGREERGASALEFGLVAPVLLMVILGIIQYGFMYWSLQTAKATAREAVRRLIVGTEWACTKQEVLDKVAMPAVGAATPQVQATYYQQDGTTPAGAPGVFGAPITVRVSFQTLDLGIPFLPVPDNANITQEYTSRVENIPPTPLSC